MPQSKGTGQGVRRLTEVETGVCPACGASDMVDLPSPHPTRSMASDGRIIQEKLFKRSCVSCGHGFHAYPPTPDTLRGLYDNAYDLGLRDRGAEKARAEDYAGQITALLPDVQVRSFVEFGCGTGSLLAILSHKWDSACVVGVEPSARLAQAARTTVPNSIRIEQAFAEDFVTSAGTAHDVCLSVNVAEHALSPVSFLNACREAVRPEGTVIVICPDGETPSSELLFYDHVSSFTSHSLAAFAHRAGLTPIRSNPLGGRLSGFRAHLLQRGEEKRATPPPHDKLADQRSRFLQTCKNCESAVERATDGEYAIFGIGEFTDLLAAYSPSVVDRASYFVVDNPVGGECHGKRVVATKDFLISPVSLLAAVHERSWASVRERFSSLDVKITHPYNLASGS